MSRQEYIEKYAVDAVWFLRLKEIRRPLLLKNLTIAQAGDMHLMEDFFSNPRNPIRSTPLSESSVYQRAQRELKELAERIVQEIDEKSIKSAYAEKLRELILEQELLIASSEEDWERFRECNIELFGDLCHENTAALTERLRDRYDLFSWLPARQSPRSTQVVPEDVFMKAKQQFHISVLDEIEPHVVYESADILECIQSILKKVASTWQVRESRDALHVLVSNYERVVYVPYRIRARGLRLRRLLAHEIGVHVVRRRNGSRARLQLLGVGLGNYSKSEEGFALLCEQVVGSRFYQYGGHDKYLALAIAGGYVDGHPRDFKETCLLLQSYFQERLRRHHTPDDRERIAKERAWRLTWRIFRGGDPAVPGCALIRDKLYHEGNVGVWRRFKDKPEAFNHAFVGKFDVTRDDHCSLAEQFRASDTIRL